MKRHVPLVLALCLAVPWPAFADFQYTETTKITGGAIVQMMKMMSVFSKEARQLDQPVTSTVLVKGNRMAHISNDHIQIIDLDKETITNIDPTQKTYSVVTFQQMKQQLEEAQRQAQERAAKQQPQQQQAPPPNVDMSFDVKVRNTGATKQVAGMNANEAILAMNMNAKDKQTGQQGSLAMTNDMWMTPEIPGYAEVREFQRKFAMKMGAMFSGTLTPKMLGMQPGASQGMAEMVKEMSKLKGVPVLQVMRMGTTANGQPLPAASEAPLPPPSSGPQMPSAGEVAEKSATSAITSKLGGLGGFGGFGRKKKQQEQTREDGPDAQKTQAGQAAQNGPAVFMESSTEITSFSSAPVDPARLAVPAGYVEVPADMRRGSGTRP